MQILTERSEPFMLAGMIMLMSIILIVVAIYKQDHVATVISLVGTWMGTIMGYFYGKRVNGHQDKISKR